jgi:precorrin-6B methylase 2
VPIMISICAESALTHWSAIRGNAATQVSAAQAEEETKRIYLAQLDDALALKRGAVAADVGSGDSPEFLPHISQIVGQPGKVICVDIDDKALRKLRQYVEENSLKNVEIQLGKPDDPMLSANSLDAVLIAFSYHEMTEHNAMLAHIRTALRPDGRLALIEATSEKHQNIARREQVKIHELSPGIVRDELMRGGFEILKGEERLVEDGGVLRYLISARPTK